MRINFIENNLWRPNWMLMIETRSIASVHFNSGFIEYDFGDDYVDWFCGNKGYI